MKRTDTNTARVIIDSVVATLIATPLVFLFVALVIRIVGASDQSANFLHDLMPAFGVVFLIVSLLRSRYISSLPTFSIAKPIMLAGLMSLNLFAGYYWIQGGKSVSGKQAALDDIRKAFSTEEQLDKVRASITADPFMARPTTKATKADLEALANWVSVRAHSCLDKAIIQMGRGDYAAARDTLIVCLAAPDLEESARDTIQFYLGLVNYWDKEFAAADSFLANIQEGGNWSRSEVLMNRALTSLKIVGGKPKAREYWKEAGKNLADLPCKSYLRGLWSYEMGKLGTAQDHFEKVITECDQYREQAKLYLKIIESKTAHSSLSAETE